MTFDIALIDNLCCEIKDHIFEYLNINVLKATNSNYFNEYIKQKIDHLVMNSNPEKYFRNVIKQDNDYVLNLIFTYIPNTIYKKKLVYRKKKLNFFEYMNHLSIYYSASKCRRYIIDNQPK
jgi:hypothetical protein|tara:strand:- start:458 stop:820 length:363 start_codon:yes stop_codon:yes gene_type:complete